MIGSEGPLGCRSFAEVYGFVEQEVMDTLAIALLNEFKPLR
jgi:hypothetical protein